MDTASWTNLFIFQEVIVMKFAKSMYVNHMFITVFLNMC